jgi:hypothetical protein
MNDEPIDVYALYDGMLCSAGYDVVVSDVVIGRLDRGETVREVVVDRGGRLTLTVTRAPAPARGKRLTRGKWEFRTLVEERQITRVACQVDEPQELAGALAEAELLAGGLAYEWDEQG